MSGYNSLRLISCLHRSYFLQLRDTPKYTRPKYLSPQFTKMCHFYITRPCISHLYWGGDLCNNDIVFIVDSSPNCACDAQICGESHTGHKLMVLECKECNEARREWEESHRAEPQTGRAAKTAAGVLGRRCELAVSLLFVKTVNTLARAGEGSKTWMVMQLSRRMSARVCAKAD